MRLVHGVIPQWIKDIDAPGKDAQADRKKQDISTDGRSAVTHFQVLERLKDFTLVFSN